jgi:hypothetical protein
VPSTSDKWVVLLDEVAFTICCALPLSRPLQVGSNGSYFVAKSNLDEGRENEEPIRVEMDGILKLKTSIPSRWV